jgi:hypothetical protein
MDWSIRKVAPILFVFLSILYSITAGGHLYSQDEEVFYYVTEGLVERGEPSIPKVPSAGSIEGRDGKNYGVYELSQSVLAIPFYWVGKWLAGFYPPIFREFFTRFAVSFFSVPLTALTVVLLLVFAKQLGFSRKTSLLLALAFGVATIVWPYATFFFRAASQTLGLLASILALYMYKKSGRTWWLVLAGGVFGLAASIKIMTLLAMPGVLQYLWLISNGGDRQSRIFRFIRLAIIFGLAALPWAIFYLSYNYYRFGGVFDTGYSNIPSTRFDTPLYLGLYGLLLSPGRSIFWYSPPLLLVFWSARKFWERHKDEAWLFGLICLSNILVYAVYHDWHGSASWGPRYLVPLTPLIVLPIGSWLEEDASRTYKKGVFSPHDAVFVLLSVLGIVVQISAVSLYFNHYIVRSREELPTIPERNDPGGPQYLSEYQFNPEYSPLIGHWRYIWPYTKNLWRRGNNSVLTETITSTFLLNLSYFPVDPVKMQGYFIHEADNLDFWWVHWRESVYPTIETAYRRNLSIWIAQCVKPAPPLDSEFILKELYIQPLRWVYFDCMRSWIYPEDGGTGGWYVLHDEVLQKDVSFLQPHLDQIHLAYVHHGCDTIGPAFRLYEFFPSRQGLAYTPMVWIAPPGMGPMQVIAERPIVTAPLQLEGPLAFLGYRLLNVNRGVVALETWWQVTEKQMRPLSIMAHLVDDDGHLVSGADGLGVPVEVWQVGDVLVQYHRFLLTPDLWGDPRGVYWLQTGVYWLDTMERQEVTGPGRDTGDRILLEEVRLTDGL